MKKKSAIVPYRFNSNKELEFLVVRNISDDRWILPKGTIEWPLDSYISSAKEAYEEAGVIGRIHPIELGVIKANGRQVPTCMLEVNLVLEKYMESEYRRRRWLTPGEISLFISDEDIYEVLSQAERVIKKRGAYFLAIMHTICNEIDMDLEVESKKLVYLNVTQSDLVTKIRVKRSKSMVELAFTSKIILRDGQMLSSEMANALLKSNGSNDMGFWSLEQEDGLWRLVLAYRTRMTALDAHYVENLVTELMSRGSHLEVHYGELAGQ